MIMSLRGRRSPARSNPLLQEGCFVVSLPATTCMLSCDALEARLQSAEKREQGRLVAAMITPIVPASRVSDPSA